MITFTINYSNPKKSLKKKRIFSVLKDDLKFSFTERLVQHHEVLIFVPLYLSSCGIGDPRPESGPSEISDVDFGMMSDFTLSESNE